MNYIESCSRCHFQLWATFIVVRVTHIAPNIFGHLQIIKAICVCECVCVDVQTFRGSVDKFSTISFWKSFISFRLRQSRCSNFKFQSILIANRSFLVLFLTQWAENKLHSNGCVERMQALILHQVILCGIDGNRNLINDSEIENFHFDGAHNYYKSVISRTCPPLFSVM